MAVGKGVLVAPLLLLGLTARFAVADLPVHCLLQDVVGDWAFYVGPTQPKPYEDLKGGSIPGCGHTLPNTAVSMLKLNKTQVVTPGSQRVVKLRITDEIATSLDGKPKRHLKVLQLADSEASKPGNQGGLSAAEGMWTMMFDEGFEIKLGDTSYFAHFYFDTLDGKEGSNGDRWTDIREYKGRSAQSQKLAPEGDAYVCHCGLTSTGWWHKDGSTEHESGCFFGVKEANLDLHQTPESVSALMARDSQQARSKKRALDTSRTVRRDAKGNKRWENPEDEDEEDPDAVEILHAEIPVEKKEVVLKPFADRMNATATAVADSTASAVKLRGKKKGTSSSSGVLMVGESEAEEQAEIKAEKAEKARREANRKRYEKAMHIEEKTDDGLPKDFDWRVVMADMYNRSGIDDLSAQFDQGNCGSCYAFSATLVLQMRFRIAFWKKYGVMYPLELSWKSATSCSPYTEGCDGGFAYLIFKYAHEVGLPLATCDQKVTPASLQTKQCDWSCYRGENRSVFYAKDYGQTGGFSHGATEPMIRREIHENGPVIVSFSTSAVPEFIYNSGNSLTEGSEVMQVIQNEKTPKEPNAASKDSKIRDWRYTTHSILAVGWGEEPPIAEGAEPVKYWIVRNSWGTDWGEDGYAKIRRGRNDAAIESAAPWVEPDLDRLPPGFVEHIKAYHAETQAGNRPSKDVFSYDPNASNGEIILGSKKNGKQGIPQYCIDNPDSIDCK